MGNFAENLNLGNRFRPPPPVRNDTRSNIDRLFQESANQKSKNPSPIFRKTSLNSTLITVHYGVHEVRSL